MTGKRYDYDAIIIGAGPNGLAAAIRLASDGLTGKVFEAGASVGGGTRTEGLMRTGYFHDICSAIHPMALASPYLKSLPLQKYGLEWRSEERRVGKESRSGALRVEFLTI